MWSNLKQFYLYQNDPPPGEDPPEGGGQPAGDDPPVEKPVEAPTIPVSVLPEDLRDKSEAEIAFTLSRLITGIASANETNAQLRAKLLAAEELSEEPPEPDPHDGKTITEIFEDDPEAGMEAWAKKKGYVKTVEETREGISSLVFADVARSIPDFATYEERVVTILEGRPNVTRDMILGAYTMAVGAVVIEGKEKESRALHSPEAPTGDLPEPEKDLPELVGTELEIFEASDMSREDWDMYKSEEIEIKVPIGGGRVE